MIIRQDKYVMLIKEFIIERTQAQRKAQVGVEHDQFFTRPEVARDFAMWVRGHPFFNDVTRIVEPAAGNKDIAKYFPGAELYDLDPQSDDVAKQDFFTSSHQPKPGTLVVMNPPYGRSSDLAIKFFNKAASFADHIAMIVPRTFKRSTVQNRLDPNWALENEYVLPRGSFYLPGEGQHKRYDVPAVAQLWRKHHEKREIKPISLPAPPGYRYVRDPLQADFAFRRKGRRAGQIILHDFEDANPNSFMFVVGDPNPWQRVDWSEYGNDVMGARTISTVDISRALSAA